MILSNTTNTNIMKAKIIGLSNNSKKLRVDFLKNKEKKILNYIRFVNSNETRHYLLAYAFIRGKSYKSIESKCSQEKRPNLVLIRDIVLSHIPKYQHNKLTLDVFQNWIEGK